MKLKEACSKLSTVGTQTGSEAGCGRQAGGEQRSSKVINTHQLEPGGTRGQIPHLTYFASAQGRFLPREWRRPVMRRSEGSKNQGTELAEDLDTGAIRTRITGAATTVANARALEEEASLLRTDDAGALRSFRQRAMHENAVGSTARCENSHVRRSS